MIATFLTTVKVRTGPSTSKECVATYSAGETIRYDGTVKNEDRLWISYIAS